MPKHSYVHQPGPIDAKLRDFLAERFPKLDFARLERLGGRVIVSVAVPYNAPTKRFREQIDETFLRRLEALRADSAGLESLLGTLAVGQLRELAAKLKQPVRGSASAAEIRREVRGALKAAETWSRISGGGKGNGPGGTAD